MQEATAHTHMPLMPALPIVLILVLSTSIPANLPPEHCQVICCTRWCCSFFCSLLSASQIKNVMKERHQTSWTKGELFKKLVVWLIMIKRSMGVRRRGKTRRGRSPSASDDSGTQLCHLPSQTARLPSSHPAPYSTASHFLSPTGNRD